ncbi:flagellar hook capping FlgD N-terminal domain-containing protein [Algisphaera agarilytica]|uniref:Basal-body rod modification protein FlgD n=1 Tax=Algisphaera agarilytica TaxID=1385975 RepID=A0A7X0LM79_9BACT|nr:flagellar hook capping FlgD N-terminal domain-containing protein [Algisphaera agarilytica]MBB6430743.1 flagellar hook assembly protein FlgD [Algisphaera agarilytica]
MSAISSTTNNPLISFTSDAQAVAQTPRVEAGASNPFAEVSSEEWLNIILEELSNQDPFEPNDTSATLEQLNSLRSIESDLSLQDQLQALVLQNSIGQAGSLIGREVEGLSNSGLNVTGIVSSVRVVDDKSQLQLESGSTIEFSNVTSVSSVAPSAATPQTTATDDANVQAINDALAGLLNGNNTDSNTPDEEAESTL